MMAGRTEALAGAAVVRLVEGDITQQDVDAVVNAANSSLMGGGGVDGAIHRAGGPAILRECELIVREQGPLSAGQAVSTTAGEMRARRVIHTVGPVWHGGDRGEAETLRAAYRSSLAVAREENLRRVAFPSISTGAYRYPLEEAAQLALQTVREELEAHPGSFEEVRFVLFGRPAYEAYQVALGDVFGT